MAKRPRDDDDSLEGDGMTAVEGEGAERQPVPREERDIDSFMAELGEEVELVMLRRYDSSVSDWVILGKLDAGEATAEAIKAKYGGGKYRARAIDSGGNHGKSVTFRLSGKPKNPDDEETDETKQMRERIAQLEKAIAERNGNADTGRTANDRLMEAIVTRLLAPPVVPQRDPLMETLITALLAGKPSSSGIDPIKLQELLQGARKEGFDTGKELGEALAATGGDGDGSVASVLAHQLPKLTEVIVNAQAREGTRRRITAPKPAENPPAVAAPKPIPETEPVSDNPIAKYLTPVIPVILKWARTGKSPDVKAVNMIDDLTESQKETIGSMAENEEFVATVMGAIPQFNSPDVKEWVEIFLKTVQDTLAPEGEEIAPETTAETVTENGGEETTEA